MERAVALFLCGVALAGGAVLVSLAKQLLPLMAWG
jgi:hypothetical protein